MTFGIRNFLTVKILKNVPQKPDLKFWFLSTCFAPIINDVKIQKQKQTNLYQRIHQSLSIGDSLVSASCAFISHFVIHKRHEGDPFRVPDSQEVRFWPGGPVFNSPAGPCSSPRPWNMAHSADDNRDQTLSLMMRWIFPAQWPNRHRKWAKNIAPGPEPHARGQDGKVKVTRWEEEENVINWCNS